MIGQKNNIDIIVKWRCKKAVPRFIILSGEEGSGRLTLAKIILNVLNAKGIIMGNSISDVRDTIEQAYYITQTTCYIFRNADDMKAEAKNALLKVVEEPPNNAYFIMTVHNIDNMLGTIRSRGTVIKMEPYTREELKSYKDDAQLLDYCSNIGQMQIDIQALDKAEVCVADVICALQLRSGTKLLKSCTQLQAKQTDTDKVDALLFMRIFEKELLTAESVFSIACWPFISKCKQELNRSTINKRASIEVMLVNILEVLKNEI